jgi:hypothetical protein
MDRQIDTEIGRYKGRQTKDSYTIRKTNKLMDRQTDS